MSWRTAAFFSWLQHTPVYSDLHAEAVALLPPGEGGLWLDIGCGPGLVPRLACARGYDALGIDRDRDMIRFARWQTRPEQRCRFETGDLSSLSAGISAEVVSAASLLFVVPDPALAIRTLWSHVRPGGKLLVIETSELMAPAGAHTVSRAMALSDRFALKLWARARNGRSVAPRISAPLSTDSIECIPLLEGLVHAWIWTKSAHRSRMAACGAGR